MATDLRRLVRSLLLGEWTTVFPTRLAKAIVDRLTYRAQIIDTATESWRCRRGRTATPRPRDAPTSLTLTAVGCSDMSRLEELRAEHHKLLHSMEFAYAMGHSRTLGRDPRLEWVVERVAELQREIEALTRQDSGED